MAAQKKEQKRINTLQSFIITKKIQTMMISIYKKFKLILASNATFVLSECKMDSF